MHCYKNRETREQGHCVGGTCAGGRGELGSCELTRVDFPPVQQQGARKKELPVPLNFPSCRSHYLVYLTAGY
jgi:hypothetical protein